MKMLYIDVLCLMLVLRFYLSLRYWLAYIELTNLLD